MTSNYAGSWESLFSIVFKDEDRRMLTYKFCLGH